MKIVGQVVKHNAFGIGVVSAQHGDYITVNFTSGRKDFVYPLAFTRYLEFTDQTLQLSVQDLIDTAEVSDVEEVPEKGFLYIVPNKVLNELRSDSSKHFSNEASQRKRYRRGIDPDAGNLAFKCKFCDGGKTNERIGFFGPCSRDIMLRNLKKSKVNSCSLHSPYCLDFIEGRITHKELIQAWSEGKMPCESSLFRDWQMITGLKPATINDNNPQRLRTSVSGKIAIMTTRQSHQSEAERMIVALYLIAEGTDDQEDFSRISAHPVYRLEFTPEESQQLLYWNYHQNSNAAESTAWGTGIYRYLPDHEALRILWDAVRLKLDANDAQIASEFLEYYCEINNLDPFDIDEARGALTLKKKQ